VATVEFLAGQFVCHTGDSLLVPVLTNDTYEASAAYLCRHTGFGGSVPPAPSSTSLGRFTNAAAMLRGPAALRRGKPDQRAFQILHAVAIPNYTVWSIVYDLPRGRIHFHTTADRTLRRVDLGDFDFDCARPGRLLDLATHCKGHAAGRFVDYTTELNRALVRGTFAHYRDAKFIELPQPVQEHLAAIPSRCPARPPPREPLVQPASSTRQEECRMQLQRSRSLPKFALAMIYVAYTLAVLSFVYIVAAFRLHDGEGRRSRATP